MITINRILLTGAAAVLMTGPAFALDVYLLRHAETMGNVTGNYTEENQRLFSPKGHAQVSNITAKLAPYHFDAICVSPTYRTRSTILPYLVEHKLTGEIWPEVEELDCGIHGLLPPADTITRGEAIAIEEEHAPFFAFRDEDASRHYRPANEAEGIAQLKRTVDLIRERYGQSEKSILIVTHTCSGGRIVEALLGIPTAGRIGLFNATLTHLRQRPDGSFQLVQINEFDPREEFEWKLGPTVRPEPGTPLDLPLFPKLVAQPTDEPYRLEWQLLNAARDTVVTGTETFAVATNTGSAVLSLKLPTEGASAGETWKLVSTLYHGDAQVQPPWDYRFLFPSYQPLPGTWKIRAGDDATFADVSLDDSTWAVSSIPGGWEADALPDYDGTAWYRVAFEIPADSLERWKGKPVAIAMGAIDDADETFLNGQKIGQSGEFPPAKVTAYDQPRVYVFDPATLLPTNILAVRVSDWGGGGGVWRHPVAVGPVDELRRAVELAR